MAKIVREILGIQVPFELTDEDISLIIAEHLPTPIEQKMVTTDNGKTAFIRNLAEEAFGSAFNCKPTDEQLDEAVDNLNDHYSLIHETAKEILMDNMTVNKKYSVRVSFTKTINCYTFIDVEAQDESDAENKAEEILENADFDDSDQEWEITEDEIEQEIDRSEAEECDEGWCM